MANIDDAPDSKMGIYYFLFTTLNTSLFILLLVLIDKN